MAALAPRALRACAVGILTELSVGLALLGVAAAGDQRFAWLAWFYFGGVGALGGVVFGIAEHVGLRRRWLGLVTCAVGAVVVFGGARFLQELIVEGNPLKAYGSLIQSSGGFRWQDLALFAGGAVCCFAPTLIARWRGASWLAQAVAGMTGALAFAIGVTLSPIRFEAFGPAVYLVPLLGRVVAFPLIYRLATLARGAWRARQALAARRVQVGRA
ncbi:MAG: hypothetical protein JKY65_28640, partial [Planctomycetes bacterium]|nr:hypothetical protein [Planctomycetota bacterium]